MQVSCTAFNWQQKIQDANSRHGDEVVGYVEEKFGDVWHCLNPSFWSILESGCDNDYKGHRDSNVTNATSSELDLHDQAVP